MASTTRSNDKVINFSSEKQLTCTKETLEKRKFNHFNQASSRLASVLVHTLYFQLQMDVIPIVVKQNFAHNKIAYPCTALLSVLWRTEFVQCLVITPRVAQNVLCFCAVEVKKTIKFYPYWLRSKQIILHLSITYKAILPAFKASKKGSAKYSSTNLKLIPEIAP